uniref:(northern house mosquito) hypothetical protein n=1 Tax=Culex pipiens TaxID=7175 RepID=A0A8D8BIV1_CULPI
MTSPSNISQNIADSRRNLFEQCFALGAILEPSWLDLPPLTLPLRYSAPLSPGSDETPKGLNPLQKSVNETYISNPHERRANALQFVQLFIRSPILQPFRRNHTRVVCDYRHLGHTWKVGREKDTHLVNT